MIEMAGIPTMIVTRQGFKDVVAGAIAGFGFAPEGPTVYEFPVEMFLQSSNLTPINENIDKIVYGLTKWQPKINAKGVYPAKKVTVAGKDTQDAVANMNLLFLKNNWSDALPLLPATDERVNWLLTGTDLPRDTVVGAGKILPRGGIATVESLAVSLAMAGGRPEYMPVLIAAVDAIIDPACTHQGWNATTSGTFPVIIVNGPVAQDIRLNSGYGLLGPSSAYPANGPIGRALRLILQDMGGAVPGMGTMSIFGATRHTNMVFAEDEAGLPKGWDSLAVEQGFPAGTNLVSHFVINTHMNTMSGGGAELMLELRKIAATMASPHTNISYGNADATPGVLLIGRGIAANCAVDLGWSKLKTKEFFHTEARTALYTIERWNTADQIKAMVDNPKSGIKAGEAWPIAVTPAKIRIVVAGGVQSGHAYWLCRAQGPSDLVSKKIALPAKAKWDALLKQAEADLGPIPAPW